MIPCCPHCLLVLYVTDELLMCLRCNVRFENTEKNRQQLLSTTERSALVQMRKDFVTTGKWSEWPNNGSKKL